MLKDTIRRFYVLLILATALFGMAGTAWMQATRQISALDAAMFMTGGLLAVAIHAFMVSERDLKPISVVKQPAR